jgi:hypothetical protein
MSRKRTHGASKCEISVWTDLHTDGEERNLTYGKEMLFFQNWMGSQFIEKYSNKETVFTNLNIEIAP